MVLQPVQLVFHQAERLQAAFRVSGLGRCGVGRNLFLGLDQRLNQELDVSLGILHAIERSLHWMGGGEGHKVSVKYSGGEGGIRTPDTR